MALHPGDYRLRQHHQVLAGETFAATLDRSHAEACIGNIKKSMYLRISSIRVTGEFMQPRWRVAFPRSRPARSRNVTDL